MKSKKYQRLLKTTRKGLVMKYLLLFSRTTFAVTLLGSAKTTNTLRRSRICEYAIMRISEYQIQFMEVWKYGSMITRVELLENKNV